MSSVRHKYDISQLLFPLQQLKTTYQQCGLRLTYQHNAFTMKSYYNCDKLNDDLEVSQLSTQPQYLAPFSVRDFPEDQTLIPGATRLIGDDTPKMPMCFTNIVYDDRQPGLVLDLLVPPVYIPETGVNDQRQFPLIIWI